MKLTIGNNNFTDIGTAVFYTQSDLDNRAYSKVQYKSNSSLLYERDFSEYDFSYEIEKNKFNDEFLIDYLGEKTLDLFEPSSGTFEKLESIIFPTLGNEEFTGPEEKYFGTTLMNNQVFVLLHAEAGIKKIELYNGIITSNNNSTISNASSFMSVEYLRENGIIPTEEPYFIITLGEPADNEVVENTDRVKLRELQGEINYEKMVWLLITSNNKVSEINLSYKSWVDSINPNRNMHRYLIRNDEFWSTCDSIRVIEPIPEEDNFKLDMNSGTLVSSENVSLDKLLAFQKIKERIDKYKYTAGQEYPNYFPYNTYKKGDKVYYGGYVWESVSDNNFNSCPPFSTKWIRKEILEDSKSIKVIVKVIPEEAGYCEPMGIISVPSVDSDIRFKIYPGPGYELNKNQPCLLDDKTVSILIDDDYDYSVPDDLIRVSNWRNIIVTNKLVFNLKGVGSKIILTAEYNGEIVKYSDWTAAFNENNFNVYKIVETDPESGVSTTSSNPYVDSTGAMDVSVGKQVELYFREFMSYSIESVELTQEDSTGDSGEITTTIPLTTLDNRESIITIPMINFTEATVNFTLTQKEVTATISEFSGFDISNFSIRTLSGNQVEFKFIDSEYVVVDGKTILADNLKSVVLTDNQGNTLTIDRFSTNNVPMAFGFSTVIFSRVNQPIGALDYGEYTLRINNLYFDTEIQILRK